MHVGIDVNKNFPVVLESTLRRVKVLLDVLFEQLGSVAPAVKPGSNQIIEELQDTNELPMVC
jgi:hypothetical protein